MELVDALGLEFYIGPPRAAPGAERLADAQVSASVGQPPIPLPDLEIHARGINRIVTAAGGDPIPDDLWPVLAERRGFVAARGLVDPDALAVAVANDAGDVPGARPVDVVELAAAAGGGAETADERVTGRVWFRRDWLDRHILDPTQCVVIGVAGESMEPVMPAGCSILVDRAQTDWREGRYFVVRTGDGLIVKRAGLADDGDWLLVSEHPSWPPAPFPDDAEIVGQVVWTARTLPGERG